MLSSENGLSGLPEHVHGFALMHMAMRRDAARLVAAAPTVRARSGIAGWWSQLRRTIEWHHRSEDELLWPELRRQVPGFSGEGDELEDDHAALDAVMAEISRALEGGIDNAALTDAAGRFERIIVEHLRREEEVVFPAFAHGMSRRQYLAVERRVIDSAGLGLLLFVLPWMFDGFDRRQTGAAAATIPPPVRLLGATALRWRYQREWRRW